MSNMTLKVEFLAGTSIRDAILEARNKTITFDLAYVEFNFNGVVMVVGKGADISSGVEMFQHAMKEGRKSVVVN